jgi:hypothetical protein
MAGSCEHGPEPLGSIKGRKFQDQLSGLQLLKEESAPWSLILLFSYNLSYFNTVIYYLFTATITTILCMAFLNIIVLNLTLFHKIVVNIVLYCDSNSLILQNVTTHIDLFCPVSSISPSLIWSVVDHVCMYNYQPKGWLDHHAVPTLDAHTHTYTCMHTCPHTAHPISPL